MIGVHKAMCPQCRQLKPAKQLHWPYNERLYCSKGCAAKAQWIITIPTQRSA